LRKYIEGFDQATMIDTARVVSAEGAALVERQTTALFGDIKELTQQMQVR
jgi:class 3 adenylate cyclase